MALAAGGLRPRLNAVGPSGLDSCQDESSNTLDDWQAAASADDAIARVAGMLRGKRVIGIGSPRASLETNYALGRLVGEENFYHGMPANHLRDVRTILDILTSGPARRPRSPRRQSATRWSSSART